MESQTLSIEGANIYALQNHILETIRPRKYFHHHNLFIYFLEGYCLRISSNLMSVLIINFVNGSKCDIELTTGGGFDEMDNDWGAERNANEAIIKDLVEISIANSWHVFGIDTRASNPRAFSDKICKFFDEIWSNE